MSPIWDEDFRCFWVTLSCLATSVFVEKPLKPKTFSKNLGYPALKKCETCILNGVLRERFSSYINVLKRVFPNEKRNFYVFTRAA